ncbi:MAG: ATP-binding protein, partial [Saprospiraceae bacterium]
MVKASKLPPIPENLVLDRLRFENPWWVTGEIDRDYDEMKRRLYFDLFYPLVAETDINRAVVLMGPRRVGKTVMMHHTVHYLLHEVGIAQKIAFVSIDNPIYLRLGLEQLFTLIRKAIGNEELNDWFIFFDEIQYLKDWEVHLKVLVDSYPHSKFIVSGSAAAALRLRSQESGAGRFTEFMLPPLTFQEYIHLKKYNQLVRPGPMMWNGNLTHSFTSSHIKELNRHFIDYINFGGYPEVIFSSKIQANPGRYIKSDIVDKVLLRDLPSLYGIQDVQELNAFFSTLAYHSGNEVSLNSLSHGSNVEKNLLKKYLEYLEAAFLIKVVHRIDDNAKRFQRAVFYKIFL